MAASVAGLTLSEAIIPLQQSFNSEELRTTKVENHWQETVNGNQQDRSAKMYLPVCDDPSKKEVFLYVIDQFLDSMHTSRLHVTTGHQCHNKFRQVLDGTLRIDWQTISDARNAKTANAFLEDLHAFIELYLSTTSRADQIAFLTKATKPFDMTVNELSARLGVINRLGRLLPGSWTNIDHANMITLFANNEEKKRFLFHMMPMAWRIKFAESAHRLDDGACTYSQLTQCFSLQEAIEKNARGRKRPRNDTSGGRGRASGRGRGEPRYGRGHGRGCGRGRGHGRGHGRNPGQVCQHGGSQGPTPNP